MKIKTIRPEEIERAWRKFYISSPSSSYNIEPIVDMRYWYAAMLGKPVAEAESLIYDFLRAPIRMPRDKSWADLQKDREENNKLLHKMLTKRGR